jgi:hypothetical protein
MDKLDCLTSEVDSQGETGYNPIKMMDIPETE